MRALILIAGAALAFAATPISAAPREHREHCDDHDRYENPYSLASIRREREREELAQDIAKAERIERQKERASARLHERGDSDDDDQSDEDDPDDG